MLNASKRLFQFLVLAAFLTLLAGPPAHAAESTLRYAAGNFGEESMDPTRTSISASLGLVGPLWDWLTEVDANGKLTPGLARSWEPAADGLSWTFKLRSGVTFHDGSEMTAEDVQFTLMEGLPPAPRPRAPGCGSFARASRTYRWSTATR